MVPYKKTTHHSLFGREAMKCRQISGEHHLKKGGDKTSINLLVYREPQAENRQQCTLSVFMKISKDTVVCIIDGMKSFPRFHNAEKKLPHMKAGSLCIDKKHNFF